MDIFKSISKYSISLEQGNSSAPVQTHWERRSETELGCSPSGNNSLAESAPVLSAVWRLLSSGRLPFCNLNSKLCWIHQIFMFSLNKTTNFRARTRGETYCPKFIKFKLLARKWNFRRPIPPPPPSPTTTNIEKNISSHHRYWPKHFLIISGKCWFISFLFCRCTRLDGGEQSECWCSLLWGLWINQLLHWSKHQPEHFNSGKIYSWVSRTDHHHLDCNNVFFSKYLTQLSPQVRWILQSGFFIWIFV